MPGESPSFDYFALLQQPRKPWIDPDELKKRYQELAMLHHPDQGSKKREADSFPYSFAQFNEAYRVLSDHRLRIQHLLKIEGHPAGSGQSVPEEFIELFSEIGDFLRATDGLLQRSGKAQNALSKSLLRVEILTDQKRSEEILTKLTRLHEEALEALRVLDDLWTNDRAAAVTQLSELQQRLAFLTRWLEQMRERRFLLSQ